MTSRAILILSTYATLLAAVSCATDSEVEAVRNVGNGRNVLLLCASLSGHLYPTVSLGQELKDQGYNVYIAAPYVSEKMPGRILDGTGITYLPFPGTMESETDTSKRNTARWSTRTASTFTMMIRARSEFYSNDGLFLHNMQKAGMFTPEGVSAKTSDGNTVLFMPDLILANHFTSIQSGEFVAQKYGVPLVFNSPQLVWDPMPAPPFHYPIHSAARSLKEMTFRDRMFSAFWYKVNGHWWAHHFAYKLANEKLKKKCKCNATLIEYPEPGVIRPKLVNTVVGFDYAIPVPPHVIYTGPMIYLSPGSAIGNSLDKSPALKEWIEQHGERTITVVSMGTHARLNEQQGVALMNGLFEGGRPAIWSLRKDNRDFLPANFEEKYGSLLRLEEWLPQRAVLAHSSVQAFVGHCGFGGTHEALIFGKPIVCLPVMADQPELASRLRDSGAGLSLDIGKLTAAVVKGSLDKLCGEQGELTSYGQNAQRLGKLMKLQGGVKRGAEIVDYIIKAGSTDHWTMPDQSMPYVVRYQVDVYANLFFAIVAALLIIRMTVAMLCNVLASFGATKVKVA